MYRFFVNEKLDDEFILDNNVLKHLKSVRIRKEEKFICVFKKKFYVCIFNEKNKRAKIVDELNENHEYEYRLILCAGIIKIKNFEWLIQKATELGVKEFYPMITKNTNSKYVELVRNKMQRFNEIIKNASEQSFRNELMKIYPPAKFSELISLNVENKYLAHEVKLDKSSNKINHGDICFYVGPEGGFNEEEIRLAIENNIQIISLGKRILRAETSSIALLSKIH